VQLSRKIVLLRQKKGWSQIDLARATGIPQPTVCRLESGDIEQPKIITVMRIARALEVWIDYLVSEDYDRAQIGPPALTAKAHIVAPKK